MPSSTKLLVITDDDTRGFAASSELTHSRYSQFQVTAIDAPIIKQANEFQPTLLMVVVNELTMSQLNQLSTLLAHNPLPVVVICERDNSDVYLQAINHDITSFLVGSVPAERIPSILDIAVARFKHLMLIKHELEATKNQLSSRKLIDQAKALLIEKQQMTEKEAYSSIRKMAMNNGQKMEEVAKNMLSMKALF